MSDLIGIMVILWTFGSVAVALHAMEQEKSGVFWGILVLVTGVFGLIGYTISLASD